MKTWQPVKRAKVDNDPLVQASLNLAGTILAPFIELGFFFRL